MIDSLVRMRDELERVADGLVAIVADSAERVPLEGDDVRRMADRLRVVEDIGRETSALVTETEFSVHLASLLEWGDLRLEVPERGFEASLAGQEEVASLWRVHGVVAELVEVLLEELVPRLESVELAGPFERMRSSFLGGVKRMPLRHTVRPTPSQASRSTRNRGRRC